MTSDRGTRQPEYKKNGQTDNLEEIAVNQNEYPFLASLDQCAPIKTYKIKNQNKFGNSDQTKALIKNRDETRAIISSKDYETKLTVN